MTKSQELRLIPRTGDSLVVSGLEFSKEASMRLSSLFGIKFDNHQFGLLDSDNGIGHEHIEEFTINSRILKLIRDRGIDTRHLDRHEFLSLNIEIKATGSKALISLDIRQIPSEVRTKRSREAKVCEALAQSGYKLPPIVHKLVENGGHMEIVWEEHGFESAVHIMDLFKTFHDSFESPPKAREFIVSLVRQTYGSPFKPDPLYKESDSQVYSAGSDDDSMTITGSRRPSNEYAPKSTQDQILKVWGEQLFAWIEERVPVRPEAFV